MLHRALFSLAALTLTSLVPAVAIAQWYDPAPLLASLRPSARAALPASAGLTRLDAIPLYDLELDANPEAQSFRVRQELYFTNLERTPLADLVFRLYANGTRRAANGAVIMPPIRLLRGGCRDERGVELSCTVLAESSAVITARPAQPIAPDARIRVWLELEGRLDAIDSSRTNLLAQGMESLATVTQSSDPSSASATDYGLLAVGDGIACMAQWYPVLAPRRAGQWVRDDRGALGDLGSDELSHVRARVSVPDGYRVATTGVTVRESVGASSVVVLSGASPSHDAGASGAPSAVLRNPRRTHEIVAAMVRDFTVLASRTWVTLERRVGDVVVRSHVLPAERAAGQRVLDAAASSLEVFERRFGPYPFADLDVCEAAVVGGAGGVEFSGLVTVASMFYRDPGQASGELAQLLQQFSGGFDLNAAREGMLEFVTAHEVAHQYWHGLVGSDSRDHPFVDEALAQYSAIIYLEDRYGRERAQRDGDANVKNNYHLLRALGQPDQPVNRAVSSFRTPLAYAGIVYGKAPYFYEAARRALGDPAFFAAMQRYVRDNAFRVAAPNAIIDALALGAGTLQGRAARAQDARIRSLARRWLEETRGDEDLGRVSLGTLAARMMGERDPARIREMDQMFNLLERTGILRAILGGSGGGGLSSLLNPSANGANGANGTNGASGAGALGALGGLLNQGGSNQSGSSVAGSPDALVQELLRALGGAGAGAGGASGLGGLGALLEGMGLGGAVSGQGARGRTRSSGGSRGAGGATPAEAEEMMNLLRQFIR